tara:strand:+ start:2640 stop:3851 length:1212 start_codon:yes stop_codon:yes gene_type:complete
MKKFNILKFVLPIFIFSIVVSCYDDNDSSVAPPVAPDTYTFERNGESTVSYGGQTTRLKQADELYSALNNASSTEAAMDLMFAGDNGTSAGFADETLNGTTKLIRSKTSAYANTAANRSVFDNWISEFANDVAPNLGGAASPGVAGDFDGYQLNAAGQEIDQLFFKSLIGAFALDQIINNYITPSQLDSGTRRDDNTAGTLDGDNPYTTMEHKWDEGFGYLYGQVADVEANFGLPAEGEATGNLLMKYFKKVEEVYEPGIAETVYNAFIAGRHAITIADYTARDAAATTIKTELSKVIGYYAIHYLNDYLNKAGSGNISGAHHSLSEGYGFMFSLQFTNDGGDAPYIDRGTLMYALVGENAPPGMGAYFADFHNLQSIYITDPNQGMIALIQNAFASAGNPLN